MLEKTKLVKLHVAGIKIGGKNKIGKKLCWLFFTSLKITTEDVNYSCDLSEGRRHDSKLQGTAYDNIKTQQLILNVK